MFQFFTILIQNKIKYFGQNYSGIRSFYWAEELCRDERTEKLSGIKEPLDITDNPYYQTIFPHEDFHRTEYKNK